MYSLLPTERLNFFKCVSHMSLCVFPIRMARQLTHADVHSLSLVAAKRRPQWGPFFFCGDATEAQNREEEKKINSCGHT